MQNYNKIVRETGEKTKEKKKIEKKRKQESNQDNRRTFLAPAASPDLSSASTVSNSCVVTFCAAQSRTEHVVLKQNVLCVFLHGMCIYYK